MDRERTGDLFRGTLVTLIALGLLNSTKEMSIAEIPFFGLALVLGSMFLFQLRGLVLSLVVVMFGFGILCWFQAFQDYSPELMFAGNILLPIAAALLLMNTNVVFESERLDKIAEAVIGRFLEVTPLRLVKLAIWASVIAVQVVVAWQFIDTTQTLGWEFWGIQVMIVELGIALLYCLWILKPLLLEQNLTDT